MGADYANATGPTLRFPVNPKQVDTWPALMGP